MNTVIQTSLVALALAYAIWFLLRKFGVFPKRKKATTKACGTNDCGCS